MSNSRTQKSKINLIIALTCQLVTTLLSFVTRRLFVNVLSENYLGVSGLFTSVLTMLSLAELGIGNAMVYSLYRPIHDNDEKMISYYINMFRKAYRMIAGGVTALGVAIMPFLHIIVNNPEGVSESIYVIYIFFLTDSAVSYLLAYKRSILIADQKNYVVITSTTITHILQLVFQYLVLLLTHNYLLYLTVQIIMTIMTNAVVSMYVNKKYNFGKVTYEGIDDKSEKAKLFNNIKSLSISKVAGVVCSSANNIIAAKIINIGAVGFASNYTLVTNAISHLMSNAINGITGSIGNLNAEQNLKNREKVFYELFTAVYIVYFIVCSSMVALINPLITFWLGEKYLLSLPVVAAIILNIYVAGINYPSYIFRTTSGHFKEATKFYVASALMNIVLSIILGKVWGLAGIYVATSIARLLTSEISDGYYGVKYGACSDPKVYFIKYYLYLFLIIATSATNYLIVQKILVSGFKGLIIKGIVSVAFCSLTCLLIVGFTVSFRNLMRRVFRNKNGN